MVIQTSFHVNSLSYSTARFKLDTHMQQTCVCLTNFAESLASGLCADCMAGEYAS